MSDKNMNPEISRYLPPVQVDFTKAHGIEVPVYPGSNLMTRRDLFKLVAGGAGVVVAGLAGEPRVAKATLDVPDTRRFTNEMVMPAEVRANLYRPGGYDLNQILVVENKRGKLVNMAAYKNAETVIVDSKYAFWYAYSKEGLINEHPGMHIVYRTNKPDVYYLTGHSGWDKDGNKLPLQEARALTEKNVGEKYQMYGGEFELVGVQTVTPEVWAAARQQFDIPIYRKNGYPPEMVFFNTDVMGLKDVPEIGLITEFCDGEWKNGGWTLRKNLIWEPKIS